MTLGLPGTYMLIYALRNDVELTVTGWSLDASIAHMAGHAERPAPPAAR